MTVKQLIEKLQTVDQNLPVCLADWNEGHQEPTEFEHVQENTGVYIPLPKKGYSEGKFLKLGYDGR